jgi:hypothetical protein
MSEHENGNGNGNGGPVLPKSLAYTLLGTAVALTLAAIFLLVRFFLR